MHYAFNEIIQSLWLFKGYFKTYIDHKTIQTSTSYFEVALVAQLDECPTGYQEVVGSTPAG